MLNIEVSLVICVSGRHTLMSKLQFIRKHKVTENYITCDQGVVGFYRSADRG